MNMQKTDTRKKYILINMAILLLFVFAAGIYNYGLKRSFWFDPEYSDQVYRRFLKEYYGLKMNLNSIYDVLVYLPYRMFGCSMKTVRVYSVINYQIIMLFATIAAVYSDGKRFEWYKLGIFAFIAVILHPGSSPVCGHYTVWFHQYPYDIHPIPVMCAMLSVMLLCIHKETLGKKYKTILKILIGAVIIIGCKKTDFIYIIGFAGPLACVGLIYFWREKRKLFLAILSGMTAVLALLHIVGFFVPSVASLFADHSYSYGQGPIYGMINFADPRMIQNYISNTMTEFLALFNIDIIRKSMLSISSLIAGFRIILVAYMLICCFKTVIDSIIKKDESINVVNIVLALGILFNLFIVMFSDYGDGANCIRYMTLILFYGAVFMARCSENIIVKLNGQTDNRFKMYFFMFFSSAIILNMTEFWRPDDYVPDYEQSLQEVSSYILDNHLGNGVAGHYYASTLTILGKGDYAVVDGGVWGGLQLNVGGFEEMQAPFNYIIDWVDAANDHEWHGFEMVEQALGKADEVIEIAGFVIYYYEQGFGL